MLENVLLIGLTTLLIALPAFALLRRLRVGADILTQNVKPSTRFYL